MSVIKDVFDIAKELISFAKEKGNAELAVQAIDMYERIIDMNRQMELLQNKIQAYDDLKETDKRIKRTNGLIADYINENGNAFKICACCWDKDKKIVQVQPTYTNHYNCAVCNIIYFYGEKEIPRQVSKGILPI